MPGRLLVTGANGYLGAHCVARWAQSPSTDIVATWHAGTNRLLADPPSCVHYEPCDLTDPSAVDGLFRRWKIDAVVHTAALLPDEAPNYPERAVALNVAATTHLLERAVGAGCRRFVYCSSISTYGATPRPPAGWLEDAPVVPSSEYGWTKLAGEGSLQVASRMGGLTGVSLRLAGIHGGGRQSGAPFLMARAARAGTPITVHNPASRFQVLFADDAAEAVRLASDVALADAYRCVNVASHVFPSMTDLAVRIAALCGSSSAIDTSTRDTADDAVMNTARMGTLLGLVPGDVEAQLRAICDAARGD